MATDHQTSGGLRTCEFVGGDLHLVLNNTLEAIEDGRLAMQTFFERHQLSPAAINRLEVIFEEMVANAIRHGFRQGTHHTLRVEVALRPGAVELTFEDDGAAFNPLEAELPAAFTTLEEARVGGLGVPLIIRLSSGLRYERGPSGPTPDHLTFRPVNRTIITVANV